jgi:L-arabinokinase
MSTGTGSTPGDVELRPAECDTGIVQIDALCPDVRASVLRAAAFHRDLNRRAAEEAMLLRDAGAALVVADIPPLAFTAAARAGIPAFALGNFTWDWIYEGYPETGALAPDLVPAIREAYAAARGAWRLPMWGGFEGIENVVDVPFVARRTTRDPRETRRAFGLPADTPVALVSFGGYGIGDLAWDRLDCLAEYTVVVTDVPGAGGEFRACPPRLLHLSDAMIYGRGWRYEDLVAAADVVVTKPGYGIIAECIANRTALLYTSRGPFREYDVLVREMPRYLRCGFIDQEALRAGRWRAALDAVLARPRPPETPRVDGAEAVAHALLDRLADCAPR